ncbi:hypothetical protein BG006_005158 [Podila minutissima]|uniref:Uncharacterized protein n=1 Tax=Podila minutissima TaxID=64525 RepID=A0A9P5SS91_9FUNG|nr:hypothetical protein BG006_005158 [Podila minutissima]
MPRVLQDQEIFLTFVAFYGATVAFSRWFPEAGNLIAVHTHPSSYLPTLKSVSEQTMLFYAISLIVDFFRVLSAAVLESAAISFAGMEPFSYLPFLAALVSIAKDGLLLACLYAFPDESPAANNASQLMPVAVSVEQAMYLVGFLALARGLYTWTYAIGRDKRQVIPKENKKTH